MIRIASLTLGCTVLLIFALMGMDFRGLFWFLLMERKIRDLLSEEVPPPLKEKITRLRILAVVPCAVIGGLAYLV